MANVVTGTLSLLAAVSLALECFAKQQDVVTKLYSWNSKISLGEHLVVHQKWFMVACVTSPLAI
jgi:hypothetical protein